MKKAKKQIGVFLLLTISVYFLITRYLFFFISVPTASMYPAIQPEDRILTTRIYNSKNIKRGEILVFQSEELDEVMVKRVIGLPGDTISITENGDVHVDGKRLDEKYVAFPDNLLGEYQVPEGKYFFLGDYRVHSFDSRKWENPYIRGEEIIGQAHWVVAPLYRFGKLVGE